MFETEEFARRVEETVSLVAGRAGLKNYRTIVPSRLVDLARSNERILLAEELKKSASERRTVEDAIQSVVKVASDAARIAASEGRDTLTESDFDIAYRANYCRIWPFCR